jgi:membrane protease YdiL (CAAX protease family)
LLLRGLLRHYSVCRAVLISAALFGLAHIMPWAVVGAFSGGIILGWVYYRTRSLLLCVLMHGVHNGMFSVVERLPFHIPGFTPPSALQFQPWWFDLAGLGALPLGVWLLVRATGDDGKSPADREAH